MNLPTPPAGEPAWSVITLAHRLHIHPLDLFDAVTRVIRNDFEHIDHDMRGVFRADLDFPDRRIVFPPWDDAVPPWEYGIPDIYLTDQSVQHVLCRFRDGVTIPGRPA